MTNDELLADQKVRDLNREAASIYNAGLNLKQSADTERHDRPPLDPPIPMTLAKEFRQTL